MITYITFPRAPVAQVAGSTYPSDVHLLVRLVYPLYTGRTFRLFRQEVNVRAQSTTFTEIEIWYIHTGVPRTKLTTKVLFTAFRYVILTRMSKLRRVASL